MDMIALTVVLLLIAIAIGCVFVSYHVVEYRDSHLEEWTSHNNGKGNA